jgi:hypothetical protein
LRLPLPIYPCFRCKRTCSEAPCSVRQLSLGLISPNTRAPALFEEGGVITIAPGDREHFRRQLLRKAGSPSIVRAPDYREKAELPAFFRHTKDGAKFSNQDALRARFERESIISDRQSFTNFSISFLALRIKSLSDRYSAWIIPTPTVRNTLSKTVSLPGTSWGLVADGGFQMAARPERDRGKTCTRTRQGRSALRRRRGRRCRE